MAISEIGALTDELLARPVRKTPLRRAISGIARFARRKPLGMACGVVILFFVIVGDLIPETLNKSASIAGLGSQPVPYVADELAQRVGILQGYDHQDLRARLQGSSAQHLLGTDPLGRDVLSRLLYGARTAVIVSFGAVFISSVVQIVISMPAGFYGGWYDKLMYRLVDVAESLPTLLVLIAFLGFFGRGLWEMVIVMGIVFGLGGRVIRAQTMSVSVQPYIEAARAVGASDLRIMMRYVLPNIMPLVILAATARLGVVVLLEASLSFLGYGVLPPFPSWGQMLSLDGRQYMTIQPGLVIYPGLAIALLVFSFNLFGDALRDELDPRLRGSG